MMLNSTFRFFASPNNKYLGGFQKFKNKKLLLALLFLCSHAPFPWMSPHATSEVLHCYSYLFTLQRYGGQGYAKNHSSAIPS